ncbi:hypothetical protein Q9295_12705 [Xinfangfangia sp. CPCC 101601]|uniref:DUF4169 family protein n=1 Tax=Pseudogemmobacter lacusdianii TaxID=3069608 RepID=A0ABU0W2C8_9RHOB|nr:hypothetical protein [Xinfangfangia sp. CPCC 101601]MDQ2067230.1 hypothetical protein [Xinfangfangia sp. CPCC 101601]
MRDPDQPPSTGKPLKKPAPLTKDDRLKAALKANMARRKAQAKARGDMARDQNNKNE